MDRSGGVEVGNERMEALVLVLVVLGQMYVTPLTVPVCHMYDAWVAWSWCRVVTRRRMRYAMAVHEVNVWIMIHEGEC
jgi:hypothetical protein